MDENIFKGKVVCILCGFCGFTKVSRDIITKNIEKLGGKVVKKISQIPDDLTHLVVPHTAEKSKLLKVLKLNQIPKCKIVTPD